MTEPQEYDSIEPYALTLGLIDSVSETCVVGHDERIVLLGSLALVLSSREVVNNAHPGESSHASQNVRAAKIAVGAEPELVESARSVLRGQGPNRSLAEGDVEELARNPETRLAIIRRALAVVDRSLGS